MMERSGFYDKSITPENGISRVRIYANINGISGVNAAISCGADGIGLFRSEFLYFGSRGLPCEEAQFSVYKSMLCAMCGKPVTVRTVDFGADKAAGFREFDGEENPALGLRGIRFCLTRPEIFRTQLRALYRASVYGDLRIMYPMITDASELYRINEITRSVRDELAVDGIPFSDSIKTGIMIETPAAAILSGELAAMTDFFSIGTNDLAQFTLACDRQNARLSHLLCKNHRAVLGLMEMTVKNAHKAGISVGVCGEYAADRELSRTFANMGVDSLSVSPQNIRKLRLL